MPFSSHMVLYFDWSEKIRCIIHGSISYPPIGSRAVKRVPDTWRSRSNVGVPKRPLGFYESPQEVLVSTDHHCVDVARCSNRVCRRDCGCTLCVYAFLVDGRCRLFVLSLNNFSRFSMQKTICTEHFGNCLCKKTVSLSIFRHY